MLSGAELRMYLFLYLLPYDLFLSDRIVTVKIQSCNSHFFCVLSSEGAAVFSSLFLAVSEMVTPVTCLLSRWNCVSLFTACSNGLNTVQLDENPLVLCAKNHVPPVMFTAFTFSQQWMIPLSHRPRICRRLLPIQIRWFIQSNDVKYEWPVSEGGDLLRSQSMASIQCIMHFLYIWLYKFDLSIVFIFWCLGW